ncbi:MAG: hypothetical protein KJ621_05370 [Proteobacteria bacterium]|nr:hypothetical protein [Pseudomonadota bacterium]
MKLTILGSGGCAVIPKPLCGCRVCVEARVKGPPFSRTGPSLFVHDAHLLVDTPAEVAWQLNRAGIERLDRLLLTHLDPDHVEGLRVVEQIALDFRSWEAYPKKRIELLLPVELDGRINDIRSWYGPVMDFYEKQGFIQRKVFQDSCRLGDLEVFALGVDRGSHRVFIYVFDQGGRRAVYAPCDLKPFPEDRPEVRDPDLLLIQPGIFETGLRHDFVYPPDHVSRTTLYTFTETLDLARRLGAKQTVFVHLEEYWHRGYDDYRALEEDLNNVRFAYDGLELTV